MRRAQGDRGFMAIGAIAACGFMFMILAGLTLLITKGVKDSDRSIGRVEARSIAEAGTEEFFSRTIPNPDYFVASTPNNYTNHPSIADPDAWWRFDDTNTIIECGPDDIREACYQLIFTVPSPNPLNVTVRAIGTSRCRTPERGRCDGYATMQMTLRRRSFLEFIVHADSEALDIAAVPVNQFPLYPKPPLYPDGCATRANLRDATQQARCLDAVYQEHASNGDDRIIGSVHTNDSRILICGQPEFSGPGAIVEIANAASPFWEPGKGGVCAGSNPIGTFVSGPELTLPFRGVDDPNTPDIDEAATYDPFALARLIASDDGDALTNPYVFPPLPVPHQVTLQDDRVIVNGSNLSFPDSGVMYFESSIDISGNLDGKLSIVVGPPPLGIGVGPYDINITGDITYACGAPIPDDCDDVLGLNAADSVVIEYFPEDRRIDAALAAVNRSVRVDEWLTADVDLVCGRPAYTGVGLCASAVDSDDIDTIPELLRPPTLEINGAVVGHYRGVYGGYDMGLAMDENDIETGTEGELISGYSKLFRHDTRLRNTMQPPYFVAPVTAAWDKVDTVETVQSVL